MSKQNNQKKESLWTKFFNIMDTLTKWVYRICNIAGIVMVVGFGIAFAVLFKRFSDNGWSFVNKKEEITISSSSYEAGMEFWEELNYAKAEENLLIALDEMNRSKGEGSIEAAGVSQKLGALYLDMGRYEESYEFLNSAYVTFYNKLGEKDGNTIITKCQISIYDIRTGNIERGFAALNEAFDQTKYVSYKIQIAQMVAQCNILLGDYRKALEWYEIIGNFYESFGNITLERVNFYNDYGVLLIELGEYERALDYFLKSVYDWQSLDIKEDLTIANVYTNLAKAYAMCGQYENAISTGEKGVSIWQSLYGESSIYVAKAYGNLASVYEDMQMADIQIEYLEQALAMAIDAVGRNHEVTAEVNNMIGNYYIHYDEVQSAVRYYEEALDIRKNLLGKNNLVTASVYQNLAECYIDIGKYEEGVENAQEAVGICEALYGRDNINTAHAYMTLARAYESMGNVEDAKKFVEIALDISARHKSVANIMTAQIYQTAGDIYLHQNCLESASAFYRKAWLIYQQLFLNEDSYEIYFDDQLKQLYDGLELTEEYESWVRQWKTNGDCGIGEEK